MKWEKSEELMRRAREVIPGGVNSPVRSYDRLGLTTPCINYGEGSKIYDADGNEYIDYVCSWGALILGHRDLRVITELNSALERGTSFGAPTVWELELAEQICSVFPGIEKVRLVNSGTEACMSAIRLARGVTDRTKVVKFKGCYHGHGDAFLIEAGSGAASTGIPSSPGVPKGVAEETFSIPFNNLKSAEDLFNREGKDIAAVIVEPVAGNMGCIPPRDGFLEGLREITDNYGALLIFDEVMTGFRTCYGGIQNKLGIVPDITCLGKIIGGGLPVGAFGGKKEIMSQLSPEGTVYQAGTLAGNPLAVRAGNAAIEALKEEGTYDTLEQKVNALEEGFRAAAAAENIPLQFHKAGAMFGLFFNSNKVWDYDTACESREDYFKVFFYEMLCRGVYLASSPFEAAFVSTAHTDQDIEKTIDAALSSMKSISKKFELG